MHFKLVLTLIGSEIGAEIGWFVVQDGLKWCFGEGVT